MADDTETTEKEEKKSSGNKVVLYLSLFLLVLVAGVAGAGYWYRDDIANELCSRNFTKVVVDDAFSFTDCNAKEEVAEGSDDAYNVTISNGDRQSLIGESATDVTGIFEAANPGVVGVGFVTRSGETENIIGTGFVISEDGLIATNQHVVSDSEAEYFIKLPNENDVVTVEEIYRDEVNDIAILLVDADNLPALTLAGDDSVKPGQPVVAIGNPLGELNSTVTSGIVSGTNRTVEIGSGSFLRTTTQVFEDTIQTDAAINPGNSGGPLLNDKAEVIGINFATISGADNLSFAIPVSYLRTRVAELNEFGRFRVPYIGVQYTSELVRFGDEVFVGARVEVLDPNGSAIDVLEVGDIIIEIDGQTLDEISLASIIQKQTIGEFVDVEVVRGREQVIEVIEIIERDPE